MNKERFYKFNNRNDFISFVESMRDSFDCPESWERFFGFQLMIDDEGYEIESVKDYAEHCCFLFEPCVNEYPVIAYTNIDSGRDRFGEVSIRIFDYISLNELNETGGKEMSKLRVWWVSQLGTDAIYIPVESVKEAKKTMDLLSYFDCFQYNQHIRPDYSNVGGLEMYDEETQEWCDWVYETDNEYIEDIDEWCEKFLSKDEQEELRNYENALCSQVRFD